MIHDTLLGYLSEKGRGTWDELRDVWDWLLPDRDPAGKAWVVAQDLAALGHIEVAWQSGAILWCAAPPVVTMIPRSGGRALVTGARTRYLYETDTTSGTIQEPQGKLLDAIAELDLWLDELPQPRAPTTLMVACETHLDAQRLSKKLGAYFTYSVAQQLASVLPGLTQYAKLWEPGALPRGFDFEVFDPALLRWVRADDASALGLYRARTHSDYVHALHGPMDGQWRRVTREHAVFEVLRWEERQVLRYDASRYELAVPFQAPLPALQARAAVLSSGLLPTAREVPGRKRAMYSRVYRNVDTDVAARIASSLSQALEGTE